MWLIIPGPLYLAVNVIVINQDKADINIKSNKKETTIITEN